MAKKAWVLGLVIVAAGAGVAWAAGNWDDAKSKADEFRAKQGDLKKLTPEETRRIVTAICEADEEARKDAGRDASDRVKSEIEDNFDHLEDSKKEAEKALDDVIADDDLKDKHDDAQSLKEDIERRWDMIDRMTRALRGANHPVVAFMLDEGKKAHSDRQESSSNCDVYEFDMDSGRADCIKGCTVIELKPDNRNAIEKGQRQVRGYRDELNTNAETRKKLIEKKSDFAKCEKFDSRVDCYKLCPEIDSETDEYKSTSVSWRTDC